MFEIKGWLRSWAADMRLVGSHLRHYEMKSRASLGQSGIAVERGI